MGNKIVTDKRRRRPPEGLRSRLVISVNPGGRREGLWDMVLTVGRES